MSKSPPSDPDAAAAALRELVREAHGAIRDLTRLLREAERFTAQAREAVDQAMQESVNSELAALNKHIAAESARATAAVEAEMIRAREWIMQNLELIAITETPEGLRAEFGHKEL